MTATRRHDAIADDLTGATEIAAIGSRHGLASIVVRGADAVAPPNAPATLVVRDSDTRLDPPDFAAKKIAELADRLRSGGANRTTLFKKTDSVLRGPVLAELETLAATLGYARVILSPANPSLGRTIISGAYFVGGVPLHETAFASDPHHPARSARVLDLLGNARGMRVVSARAGDELPSEGIIVADAATLDDVRAWAQRIDADTLPAGGGDFFEAILGQENAASAERPVAFSVGELHPALFVMGSVAPASRQLRELAAVSGVPILSMPEASESPAVFARWCDAVADALSREHVAMIVAARPPGDDTRRIREALARVVVRVHERSAFRHLVVEGGATSAAVLDALGWSQLELAHEWARGVASLRPAADRGILVTFKPGSYAWPPTIRDLLAPPTNDCRPPPIR